MAKTLALAFFILTSLTLGALLVQEKQRTTQQTVRATDLQGQITKQRDELQRTKAAAAELEQKRAQLAARNKAAKQALLEAQTAAIPTPAVADASPTPGLGADKKKKVSSPFADSITKMMKDPAMKNMMRTGQATALRQMYGDLVKGWNLSPDEAKNFYDLLLDKQMDQLDQGMKLLEKGSEAVKAVDLTSEDAKLKTALGDNFYQQYQDYQKTITGRFAVNQFQQQLATSNTPVLTSDQSATLLQTITEENAHRPPGSYAGSMGANGNAFSMDQAQVDQFVKTQTDLNNRIDARMANTLSAEQLRVLKEQQQQMLTTQQMGMEMAAKMMGPSPTP